MRLFVTICLSLYILKSTYNIMPKVICPARFPIAHPRAETDINIRDCIYCPVIPCNSILKFVITFFNLSLFFLLNLTVAVLTFFTYWYIYYHLCDSLSLLRCSLFALKINSTTIVHKVNSTRVLFL